MTTTNMGLRVLGTDGIPPVHEADGVWKIWNLKEIFTGHQGASRYVPKVGDYVIDTEKFKWYVVVSVDTTTYLSELKEIDTPIPHDKADQGDKIITTTKRCRNETFRCFLDTSVTPHTLAVDARLRVNGTMCHHAQICRGSRIDGTEEVISFVFDQHGRVVSQNIALELVAMDSYDNRAIKSVPVCHTTYSMIDGEVVELKIFNDVGTHVYSHDLIVVNTSAMRQTDTAEKYIQDITLDSPFMSDADPTMLHYPLGVPVRGLNLSVIVHYSDGTTKRYPAGGPRAKVLGLRDYIGSSVGYMNEFSISYIPTKGESIIALRDGLHVNSDIYGERYITKRYRSEVVEPDGSYAVKLLGYPEWVNDLRGWRMRFFLTNLDRTFIKDVTPWVRYDDNRNPFNGKEFGTFQRFQVSLNLKNAHITNKDYTHTQVMDVNLERNGTDKSAYLWSVGFEINQTPAFGVDNFVIIDNVNQNYKELDITLGETDKQAWLDRVYRLTKPVFDSNHEARAPEPNIFQVLLGNSTSPVEFKMDQWNQILAVHDVLDETDNVYIKFIKRTNDTDMFLSIAGIPYKHR